MLIFLYGSDTYRRMKKRHWYAGEFLKKHKISGIGEFDMALPEEKDELVLFLSHRSMFDPMKLAVLENASFCDAVELKKILVSYAEDKATHVVLSEEHAPHKSLAALVKKSTAVKCDLLRGSEWEHFIESEARVRGIVFEETAFDYLRRIYESDSWRLATELDKIGAWKKGKIQIKDLEKLGIELPPDTWKLTQGMRGTSVSMRLSSLEMLFAQGEPAAKTFNILSSLWREKIAHFAAYDLAVKTGKFEYEEALVALAVSD